MRCDRAECLSEASDASITEEADQTKSADYADYTDREEDGNEPQKSTKGSNEFRNPFALLVPSCGWFCVICEICGLILTRDFSDQLPKSFILAQGRQI